ncbi:hypothetical protein F383_37738 [Gossypium arboreum]|uniref:Uncharacterized protein n=1 Tax=Gossypium arboreum TaxID=29729 RepID=A0A0B0MCY2_GOSAR|nr:hypothetical protein F383_37738 [Gossypium arboreum]
MSEVHGSAYLK